MKIPFVDLKAQYCSIKPEIDRAIQDVISSTAFIKGYFVERFEQEYAQRHRIKHCVSCANGTDALYIAQKMLGIGFGDEVITTALSWISTSESISLTGAKPIFVDIEEDYFTIDPSKIEEKITPRTKAIIPVHLYGQCADMDPILAIARKHNLYVIEDTAQAHFAEYKGRLAGTLGTVGTFSFYPSKNLGAYGDAGAIITNDDMLAEGMRMFANHGALEKHYHKMEGINSRLDALQAAILLVKLNHIGEWNEKRIGVAKQYNKLLKGVLTPWVRAGNKHVYHVYCINTLQRDYLKQFLQIKGIHTAIHYPTALPFLDAYPGHDPEDFPVAYYMQHKILSLPIFPELSSQSIEYIAKAIAEYK